MEWGKLLSLSMSECFFDSSSMILVLASCRGLRALHSAVPQSSSGPPLSRTGSANTLTGLLSRMHSQESPLDGSCSEASVHEQVSFMSHASVWTMTQGLVGDSGDSSDICASGM